MQTLRRPSHHFIAPRRDVAVRPAPGLAIALVLLLAIGFAASPARAASTCNRILVETRDGHTVISSYTVAEPEYVAKMHRLVEQNGEDGTWSVAAGELAAAGYSVTYTCLT